MTSLRTILERGGNLLRGDSYVPNDYYIFDDLKLVYISIPKVACTAIKIALMDGKNIGMSGPDMDIHSRAERFHFPRLTRPQRGYYKFAFVRNPFDRLISCYEDKVRRPTQHTGRYYFDTGYNRVLIRRLFKVEFTPDITFEEFVSFVQRVPDRFADNHFRSQCSMLGSRGKLDVDYIGRFEDLSRDWKPIAHRFGFPELEQRNPSTRQQFSSYYSDRATVQAVAMRYEQDITQLDYSSIYQEILDGTT